MHADTAKDLQRDLLLRRSGIDTLLADIATLSPKKLDRWLGSHLLHDYSGESMALRDRVDVAVDQLGLIELGILFDAVSPPTDRVATFLSNEAVTRYAFTYYPQLLPRMLYQRLQPGGGHAIQLGSADTFFEVHRLHSMKDDDELNLFLGLLDDISIGDLDLAAFLEALGNANQVRDMIGSERSAAQHSFKAAFFGLVRFLQWSGDIHALLDRTPERLAQSAIWHAFGYWFGLVGGLVYGTLSTSLELVDRTLRTLARESGTFYGNAEQIELQMRQLRELTSHKFGAELEFFADDLSRNAFVSGEVLEVRGTAIFADREIAVSVEPDAMLAQTFKQEI